MIAYSLAVTPSYVSTLFNACVLNAALKKKVVCLPTQAEKRRVGQLFIFLTMNITNILSELTH